MAGNTSYADRYRGIDFRLHPELYRIGRGEQGVLIAEPYKSEILPHWRFKTAKEARASALSIYKMFLAYKRLDDFVGMDMARKFLMMGWTRARRYANHASGKKFTSTGHVKPQAKDAMTSEKAKSAEIFFAYYTKAKENKMYLRLKDLHQATGKKSRSKAK